jgi:hypothetical protein
MRLAQQFQQAKQFVQVVILLLLQRQRHQQMGLH